MTPLHGVQGVAAKPDIGPNANSPTLLEVTFHHRQGHEAKGIVAHGAEGLDVGQVVGREGLYA